ncbi:MAG: hypothetical protein KY447_09275 [Actinobacteria bacterium]|nr:hypothetical protein [Actinomycetota bacterium]
MLSLRGRPRSSGQLASRPKAEERDIELKAARADAVRLGEALKEMAVKLMLVEGKKRALGLSGRVPGRVDEATKAGLLDLLDVTTDAGWSWRGACRELELGEVR